MRGATAPATVACPDGCPTTVGPCTAYDHEKCTIEDAIYGMVTIYVGEPSVGCRP